MSDVPTGPPTPGAADLVRLWSLAAGRTAVSRVAELLVAVHGDDARRDPLGVHHQRVLDLHRRTLGRPLDAVVDCARCGTENEFDVPVAAICALPAPDPAPVELRVAGVEVRYRLPTLADMHAVTGAELADGAAAIARRTCLEAEPPDLTPGELDRLAGEWERVDPAAAVQVDLVCAGCDDPVAADVPIAELVARDLDAAVSGLLHEVDVVARAYGWSEDAILALPAPRRRRYVAMIGQPAPGRALAAVAP